MPRAEASDGRVLRGHRNRARIVDALRELVRHGVVRPSAEQVATAAGVGERSVFRHFRDMESLYAEIGRLVQSEVAGLVEPGPPTEGALSERIRGLVAWRARIFERIAPFEKSGSIARFGSPVLQRQHASLGRTLRKQLQAVFGAELGGRPDVLEAVDALASIETWQRLRGDQRLEPKRAQRVVETGLEALLASRGTVRSASVRPVRRRSKAT
jgi:AcrR family transcriptional regulator